jgi:2,3-bisphosphoglycerate-independent phosphoglycerate mutase
MNQIDLMKELHIPSDKRIVLLVIDGLGGLPGKNGKTELEAAKTPNMDSLALDSILGLSIPVIHGLTPGSGPGHLALFGYDPLEYQVGRGVLEALGVGLEITPESLAARGNFCSLDPATHVITDRRAGRIPTEECARLVNKLKSIKIDGIDIIIRPVKDYRFALVLSGDGLFGSLTETDPQRTGVKPLPVKPLRKEAKKSAEIINEWIEKAFEILKDERPANGCTLRGIAKDPGLPSFSDVYGLTSCAIATYPMYKGIARLAGMEVVETGDTIQSEVETLKDNWEDYDFFFFHVKKTDSAGEDGDFDRKASIIEETDRIIPDIIALKPDVFIITGDHSTPAALKSHSWHELPILLYANHIRKDSVAEFGERACMQGGLGHIRHIDIMPLAMAHAEKLIKYGA